MEITTVHGLLVFLFVEVDTTISSNMGMTTSSQKSRGAVARPRCPGVCCRLRFRCLRLHRVPASYSRRRRAERRYQNWSTFLPQSPPPGQKRKPEAPVRPSGKAAQREEMLAG